MTERLTNVVGRERRRRVVLLLPGADGGFGSGEVTLDLLRRDHGEVRVHPGADRSEHSVELHGQVPERTPCGLHLRWLGGMGRVGGEHSSDRGLPLLGGSRDDLVREAFLWYLQHATAELARLRHDQRTNTATSRLVEFVVSLVRQESHNQPLVRAEYGLIMFAGRDPALREELRNWELVQRRHLADELRAAGSRRPDAGAATLVALVRGLELELLTHAPLTAAQLRGRVQPVVLALV